MAAEQADYTIADPPCQIAGARVRVTVERPSLFKSSQSLRAFFYVANGEVNAYELQVIDTNDFRNGSPAKPHNGRPI